MGTGFDGSTSYRCGENSIRVRKSPVESFRKVPELLGFEKPTRSPAACPTMERCTLPTDTDTYAVEDVRRTPDALVRGLLCAMLRRTVWTLDTSEVSMWKNDEKPTGPEVKPVEEPPTPQPQRPETEPVKEPPTQQPGQPEVQPVEEPPTRPKGK